jgi:two-component system, NarL family, response regulator LiaR
MEKIKVMIADDHPAFRDGLARILQEENDLEVVATSGNGYEALELALKFKPQVIIMDISMPKMNGIEAVKRIKARAPEISIIIVSAYGYHSYVVAALEAGAAGYLLKNSRLLELKKSIRLVHSGDCVFDMKAAGRILANLTMEKPSKLRDLGGLRPREIEVLNLAAQGGNNKEIANRLEISERTVQTHLVNIFRKLRVSTRTEAVLRALKEGWIALDDLSLDSETSG